MSLDLTQEQWMQALYQQAVLLFGRERAEILRPQLQERAGYLWLLSQHLPHPEEEPYVVFPLGSQG